MDVSFKLNAMGKFNSLPERQDMFWSKSFHRAVDQPTLPPFLNNYQLNLLLHTFFTETLQLVQSISARQVTNRALTVIQSSSQSVLKSTIDIQSSINFSGLRYFHSSVDFSISCPFTLNVLFSICASLVLQTCFIDMASQGIIYIAMHSNNKFTTSKLSKHDTI